MSELVGKRKTSNELAGDDPTIASVSHGVSRRNKGIKRSYCLKTGYILMHVEELLQERSLMCGTRRWQSRLRLLAEAVNAARSELAQEWHEEIGKNPEKKDFWI